MSEAKWYVLHVYSGFENKVKETIHEKATKLGLDSYIEEIMVPTEDCLLYTSPSPRDLSTSRMPSSA